MVAAKLPRGITRFRGRYRVRIDAYSGTHSIGVFDTVRDARAALEIAKGERARGTFVPPSFVRAERRAAEVRAETEGLALGEWAEQWLEELAANPDRSPSTVVSYRSVLRAHVLPELGATRLADLKPAQVAAHLARLRALPSRRHPGARANGVAPNAARVLRSCLNAAIERSDVALDSFAFPEAPSQSRVRPGHARARAQPGYRRRRTRPIHTDNALVRNRGLRLPTTGHTGRTAGPSGNGLQSAAVGCRPSRRRPGRLPAGRR